VTERRFGMDLGEAIALTTTLTDQLDAAIDARAELLQRSGQRIACARGCNACCHTIAVATEPEVVRIARWLDQPEHAESRAAFVAAYPVWRERLGPALDEVIRVIDRGSAADTDGAFAAAFQRRALCPFNRDGACTIYPVRPMLCRNAFALDTSADCAPDAGAAARYYRHEPTEEILTWIQSILGVTHAALRRGAPREPLCVAVARRLEDPDDDGDRGPRSEPSER
jgi:Fe-S-cluster containining protein